MSSSLVERFAVKNLSRRSRPTTSICPHVITRNKTTYTVVMIRHGESDWNLHKRFTGWADVPLTSSGEGDAKDAGVLLGQRKIRFDVAFTSNLERAWRTCAMVLAASGQPGIETIRSWRLNERHYGALQGHSKNCPRLLAAFGEEKVIDWRRSFDTAPPSLYDIDFHRLMGGTTSLQTSTSLMNPSYINLAEYHAAQRALLTKEQHKSTTDEESTVSNNEESTDHLFPPTESLKQCQDRAYGYWESVIAPRVLQGHRVLVVAHANTIRALVKKIDDISDEQIPHLKIPNGVPLVYTLDENLKPVLDISDDIGFQANYLVSARNHGRVSQ